MSRVEVIANVVALVVAVVIEFFVLPRLRVSGTVLCPLCRRDNAAERACCAYCQQTWKVGTLTEFMPNVRQVRAASRAHTIAIGILIAWVLLCFPLPLYLGLHTIPQAPLFVAFYYVYELTIGVMLGRIVRSLREHRGSLCLHCAYPLDATMTQCPECGTVGDVATSREAWSAAGLWTPDEETAREMVAAKELSVSVSRSAEGKQTTRTMHQ